MAIIHHTTLSPTKLELLAPWLLNQPWYAGDGRAPELTKAGGFRLDDPEGAVGMEFMVATDTAGPEPVTYHVPFTYRGAPLGGAGHALVGTLEHGVLGKRWVYDGTHDPVLATQLFACLTGTAAPQAQSETDALDPTVLPHFAETGHEGATGPESVTQGEAATDIHIQSSRPLVLRVHRVLTAGEEAAGGTLGHISATWTDTAGEKVRGVFVTAHERGEPGR
ncbi:1,4-alpha-glucan branching protein [Streptomyces albofaciens JCM 4342]|uniref:maltokinase N-terminal cap-like domain-containing protein n=1 Tax=Streptomyces albofaciens TaxID=66866 RepID=UPI001239E3A2|nr:1,4-alpha-glucan branching protein [Streptomyces albofaciens]KAA6222285.1 1,4-alpha-glucan branching protein [Streptomyces albofaciens JCM 4342]